MALITTYATLQAAVVDELNRADLTEQVKIFIQTAEGNLKRDPRVRQVDGTPVVITSLSDAATTNWLLTNHPDVYLYATLVESAPFLKDDERIVVWRGLLEERLTTLGSTRLDPTRTLSFTTYTGLLRAIEDWLDRPGLGPGPAAFVTIAEGKLKRDPRVRQVDGTPVVITSLTSGSPTNWLLTNHPDVYLYASLVQAAPYLGDDARVATWQAMLEESLDTLASSRLDPTRSLALDSYANFQRIVIDYLDRGGLSPIVPIFIQLAEASLRKDVRVRKLKYSTHSISQDALALPSDCARVEAWHHDGPTYFGEIQAVGLDQLGSLKARFGTTGVPSFAAIVDNVAYFAPAPDATYATKLTYWMTISALSAGTNWLFTSHPDIYLLATLCAAEPYLKNDPRLAMWKMELEEKITALDLAAQHAQFGGSLVRQFEGFGADA